MTALGAHRINIEGRWDIRDLYVFPHRYAELYSFLYALSTTNESERAVFSLSFCRYPWAGGYSAVNFYEDLYIAIPESAQPVVRRIEYASPGFIEIGAVLVVVSQIDAILRKAVDTLEHIDATYDRIYKRAKRRHLLSLSTKKKERELQADDSAFLGDANQELAEAIGLTNADAIDNLIGGPVGQINGTPEAETGMGRQLTEWEKLAKLKILSAFWRRVRELTVFVRNGKVHIVLPAEQSKEAGQCATKKSETGD